MPDSPPCADWWFEALRLVHTRFRDRLRIADLARAVAVHPAHLATVFRRVHRMPLGRYIRSLKVDWAAEQLRTTDLPISVVASQAGFADQAHLTRCFHREVGTTPAAFRRARQKEPKPRGATQGRLRTCPSHLSSLRHLQFQLGAPGRASIP